MRFAVQLAVLALTGALQVEAAKRCGSRTRSATRSTSVDNANTNTPVVSSTATQTTLVGDSSGSIVSSSVGIETGQSSSITVQTTTSSSSAPGTLVTASGSSSATVPTDTATGIDTVSTSAPVTIPTDTNTGIDTVSSTSTSATIPIDTNTDIGTASTSASVTIPTDTNTGINTASSTSSSGATPTNTATGIDTSSPTSSSTTAATGTSANTGSDTNTAPSTAFTSTTGSAGTPTTLLTTVTQSDGGVVTNVVKNGNFARNLDGHTVEGDATYNGDDGYTGDKSTEKGCADLKVTGTGNAATSQPAAARRNNKRQSGSSSTVSISQALTVDPNTDYTLRFYYSIVTASASTQDCRLMVSFDSSTFWSEFVVQPAVSPSAYIEVVKQVRPPQANTALRFSMRCDFSGSTASVLIDSIFLSNKVTPATINQYVIDFGTADGTVPVSSFTSSTTTLPALPPLRTQECVQAGTVGNGLSASESASWIRPASMYDARWPNPVTFRSCIEHCQNAYQYCGAVSWDAATLTCQMYKGDFVQIGFAADAGSNLNFYEGSCLRDPDKTKLCGTMGEPVVADSTNPAYIRSNGPNPQPAACSQVCVGINMGCVAFSFDALTGLCDYFRETRENIPGYTPVSRSSTLFFNYDCWT